MKSELSTTSRSPESRLERQLRLVEYALTRDGFRFQEALEQLKPISTATLTRLLRELEHCGMLVRTNHGTYLAGQRHTVWQQHAFVAADTEAALAHLGHELCCTVTLWEVHDRAQRCLYRWLDEYSPAFAAAGVIRPLTITAGGGGLFMTREELSDDKLLETQAARTPQQPPVKHVRAIARKCIHDRIYDDRGYFYNGCRRLALPIGSKHILACAFTDKRFIRRAIREATLAEIRATTQILSKSKAFTK